MKLEKRNTVEPTRATEICQNDRQQSPKRRSPEESINVTPRCDGGRVHGALASCFQSNFWSMVFIVVFVCRLLCLSLLRSYCACRRHDHDFSNRTSTIPKPVLLHRLISSRSSSSPFPWRLWSRASLPVRRVRKRIADKDTTNRI